MDHVITDNEFHSINLFKSSNGTTLRYRAESDEGPCSWADTSFKMNPLVKKIKKSQFLVATDKSDVWVTPNNYSLVSVYKINSDKIFTTIALPSEGSFVFAVHEDKPVVYINFRMHDYQNAQGVNKAHVRKSDSDPYLVLAMSPDSFKFISDPKYYDLKKLDIKPPTTSVKTDLKVLKNRNFRFEFLNEFCT